MIFSKLFLVRRGLIFVSLLLLACSGSSDTTTGPIDDESFLYMKETTLDDIEDIIGITLQGFENFDGFDTLFYDSINRGFYSKAIPGPALPSSKYFNYNYANGWHILNAGADTSSYDDSSSFLMQIDLSDSVQFKEDNQIVSEPDENTNFLDFRFHMQALMQASAEDFALGFDIDNFNIRNQYTILPSGNINVNGVIEYNYEFSITMGESTGTASIDYDMTLTDLVLEPDYGCPQSGTISAAASITAVGEGSYESGQLSMTITFINAYQMQIHFVMDGSVWDGTVTYDCNDFAASPLDLSSRLP